MFVLAGGAGDSRRALISPEIKTVDDNLALYKSTLIDEYDQKNYADIPQKWGDFKKLLDQLEIFDAAGKDEQGKAPLFSDEAARICSGMDGGR